MTVNANAPSQGTRLWEELLLWFGRARGGSASAGGHDERERTLDQILTEMDGFTGSEGVVVLGRARR